MIPGVERHPLKKLVPDEKALFELLERWRGEAVKAGKIITRITVAYEAGRDGFWLARWLRARGFEVYVVHSSSVAVTREHRRAKTDRLDCEMLKRVFIGWLRGERDHCRMVAIATQTQEDAKRPNRERENLVGECTRMVGRLKAGLARLGIRSFNPKLRNAAERLESLRTPEDVPVPANTLCELRRDMARLRFVKDQIKQIERARVRQLEQAPEQGPQQMVRLLARVLGIGIETADMSTNTSQVAAACGPTPTRYARDDTRGARHLAPFIAPQPCIRWIHWDPDHDATMRIGGEAPGRRAHSQERL